MMIHASYTPSRRTGSRSPITARGLVASLGLVVGLVMPSPLIAGERCSIDFESSPCLTSMIETIRGRGWVGIHLETLDHGAWAIRAVVPGSPAEAAGLLAGDRLLALNGVAYTKRRMPALERIYGEMRPGREVTYTVGRGQRKIEIEVTLGKIPEHIVAEWVGRAVLESYDHQHDGSSDVPRPPATPARPDRSPSDDTAGGKS